MTEHKAETAEKVYRGSREVFRLRTSLKRRRCEYRRSACLVEIAPGQQYVHVTVYPGHDYIDVERPTVGACCLGCASTYNDMGSLVPLPPVTTDGADRD